MQGKDRKGGKVGGVARFRRIERIGRIGREGSGLFVVVVDGRSENARPAGLFAGLLGISHAGKIKEVLKCLPGKAFSRAVITQVRGYIGANLFLYPFFCRAVITGGITAIAVISVFISLLQQGC